MAEDESLSIWQRIYRQLMKVWGPADVRPVGTPAAHNPDDPTVPPGYHLESLVDEHGVRRERIAVQDEPDE